MSWMSCLGELFQRTKSARGYTNALTIDFNRLQIHILATFSRNVRVAAGVAIHGGLSSKLANARHSLRSNG